MTREADVLAIEHFLQPGTLIVIDGKTTNALLMRCNTQRNWKYYYDKDWDQHFFELAEEPLCVYSKKMIDYCFGYTYYQRLKRFHQ